MKTDEFKIKCFRSVPVEKSLLRHCNGSLSIWGEGVLRCRKCGALYTEGLIRDLLALNSRSDRGIIKP